MKKYYIYPKYEMIKRKKKNWGYIEQEDSGNVLKVFIKPNYSFARTVNNEIQRKLIMALERMDLIVKKVRRGKE